METTVTLYNVTEDKLNYDSVEMIPSENDTKIVTVWMNGIHLQSYAKNTYTNKMGVGNFYCLAGPILFTKDALLSSWIGRSTDKSEKPMLHW